ncbi:MAG TPA: adenylate/guanylate cyclase domain-containing protein, partial [Candidatus Rifleibacterium sp.]|nr:adenylate/guanylate cyclase domain-containing protein [Candidatus Rifleibacterium sp.]
LINVAADLDATVRYAPLAFHPDEMHEFLPTLGYATWIASLIDRQRTQIVACLEPGGPNLQGPDANQNAINFLQNTVASGPFEFRTTGHAGLDVAARRLELKFIARLISQQFPTTARSINAAAGQVSLTSLPATTWLEMPPKPLPIIGDADMPCLRLPFFKTPPPRRGDGIETISLGTLIESDADRSSTLLNHRNLLVVEAGGQAQRARIGRPAAQPGTTTLTGRVVFAAGPPVAEAEVLAMFSETGYWQETHTDADGAFALQNLPAGLCTIQITAGDQLSWQRGVARVDTSNGKPLKLPLLMLASQTGQIEIPPLPEEAENLAVFGEPLPMLLSDATGRVPVTELPPGFSIAGFDEEQTVTLASGTLKNPSGEPIANQTVAVTANDNLWTLRFFNWHDRPAGRQTTIIKNLPNSLDARIAVFGKITAGNAQKTSDLTILPDEKVVLSDLPAISSENIASSALSFDYPGIEAFNLTLISETGLRIRCTSDQTVIIPPGKYLVLSEMNGARGMFRNYEIGQRTVFIGSALPSDQDFIVTPINFMDPGSARLPGVNLHANVFAALSEQHFLRALPTHSDAAPVFWPLLQLALTMPVLLLLNLVFIRAGAFWGGIGVIFALTSLGLAATGLFLRQMLLPVVFPAFLTGSFGVIRGYLAWAIARRQEKDTRQTFGRFISSAVVNEILKHPDALKPGGEKKELTVMFTDLAGFTTISEKLAPEQLTELMNEYLDEMTRILFAYGGTLDKYIGDAIMGFWNHPTAQPDHAQRAVECAISMQRKLAELRQKWLSQGLPKVEVRAGINTAVCMVGFIGSDIQMNFTCLGDGVNLASRLEGANKAYNTLMMISDTVHAGIDKKLISTRFLDFLAVKGKNKPVEVYEVRGYRRSESELWSKAEPLYQEGIKLYLNRNWQEAEAAFFRVLELMPDDGPSKVYIDRCVHFKQEPPPQDWDGRFILKSK